MTGKKIKRADFIKNYMDIDESEINADIPEPEYKVEEKFIYNAISLHYHSIVGETAKGICLNFKEGGPDHWFSKALARVYKNIHVVSMPKNFAVERNLIEYKVKRNAKQ